MPRVRRLLRSAPALALLVAFWLPGSPAAGEPDAAPDAVPDAAEQVRPLPVGAALPAATVHAVSGEPVGLGELNAGQLRALVFYRGGW